MKSRNSKDEYIYGCVVVGDSIPYQEERVRNFINTPMVLCCSANVQVDQEISLPRWGKSRRAWKNHTTGHKKSSNQTRLLRINKWLEINRPVRALAWILAVPTITRSPPPAGQLTAVAFPPSKLFLRNSLLLFLSTHLLTEFLSFSTSSTTLLRADN